MHSDAAVLYYAEGGRTSPVRFTALSTAYRLPFLVADVANPTCNIGGASTPPWLVWNIGRQAEAGTPASSSMHTVGSRSTYVACPLFPDYDL